MSGEQKLWYKLDNAAKIYPAAMRKDWTALFRISADLTEPVDPKVLKTALRSTLIRIPSYSVRLRRGVFWFYLEHSSDMPDIQQDVGNPCVRMDLSENKRFMFRVRYFGKRIAVETFHVLSDGTGGMCFLKTLVAEYLRLKYGAVIPRDSEILDCSEEPKPEEAEDAYIRYAGNQTRSRKESDAYHISGDKENPDVIHITTGMISVEELLAKAREKNVTITEFLAAVLLLSIDTIQRRKVKKEKNLKPVKVNAPINLRTLFPSVTLRNFALYTNPGIEPRLGRYSFDEILKLTHHHMGAEVTKKNLRARFATNVQTEKSHFLRVTPLFLKNVVMRYVFYKVGDKITSTSLSNLGAVRLPDEMARYIKRMDFILGPLSQNRVISSVISYGGVVNFTFTRTIKDSAVEREVFRNLVRLGLHVKIESNNQW